MRSCGQGVDFAAMDFATRDRYRHAIEELARGSGKTELEVTRRAIRPPDLRPSSPMVMKLTIASMIPGTTLSRAAGPHFERELGFRPSLKRWLVRTYTSAGIFGYLAAITLLSALFLGLGLLGLHEAGVNGPILYLLALLGLVPATDAAVAIHELRRDKSIQPRGTSWPGTPGWRTGPPPHPGCRSDHVEDICRDR